MQGTGWLMIGVAAAVLLMLATPSVGLSLLSRFALAAMLLLLGVALYFRAHWAATATALRVRAERDADVAHRLERLAEDLERSGFVIADNLEESRTASDSTLYLDGARSHAARLGQLVARCRGLAGRLTLEPEGDAGSPARSGHDPVDSDG